MKNLSGGDADYVKRIPVGVVYKTGPVQLAAVYNIDKMKDAENELMLRVRYFF